MKNREIKFRLQDKEGTVIGYENHIINEFGCWQILQTSLRGDFLDTDTMNVREGFFMAANYKCQFTGLKDKNGKEIYEGDILSYPDESNMIVGFSDTFASFILNKNGWMFGHYFGEAINPELCEVIGNIHENKNLLNEK